MPERHTAHWAGETHQYSDSRGFWLCAELKEGGVQFPRNRSGVRQSHRSARPPCVVASRNSEDLPENDASVSSTRVKMYYGETPKKKRNRNSGIQHLFVYFFADFRVGLFF